MIRSLFVALALSLSTVLVGCSVDTTEPAPEPTPDTTAPSEMPAVDTDTLSPKVAACKPTVLPTGCDFTCYYTIVGHCRVCACN
jgi:hypothetical protein